MVSAAGERGAPPRVLVVGASAGIGRHLALAAVRAGAAVVASARRKDALDELVAEAGGGTAIAADICDAADRRALVDGTRAALGGIDLVISTVGLATLARLADMTDEAWRRTFEVNVIGINALIGDLIEHLEPGGIVAVTSSETVTRPRTGLVAYAASKAALEVSLEGWRLEHPSVRFSCIAVGSTFPTEFGLDFDGDTLGVVLDEWQRQGLMQDEFMDPPAVAQVMLDTYLGALAHPGIGVEHLRLRSPSPVAGSVAQALGLDSPGGA